ncbi:hypothetical protein [Cerasicoccus frondis]|uniref:hypothetical protein n=1 Tax=Cerasicoccus frondis TaxID=490090 RepID=UPI002852ACB9|nr:hypothetical protein [Cerasicoccus frondis]
MRFLRIYFLCFITLSVVSAEDTISIDRGAVHSSSVDLRRLVVSQETLKQLYAADSFLIDFTSMKPVFHGSKEDYEIRLVGVSVGDLVRDLATGSRGIGDEYGITIFTYKSVHSKRIARLSEEWLNYQLKASDVVVIYNYPSL